MSEVVKNNGDEANNAEDNQRKVEQYYGVETVDVTDAINPLRVAELALRETLNDLHGQGRVAVHIVPFVAESAISDHSRNRQHSGLLVVHIPANPSEPDAIALQGLAENTTAGPATEQPDYNLTHLAAADDSASSAKPLAPVPSSRPTVPAALPSAQG